MKIYSKNLETGDAELVGDIPIETQWIMTGIDREVLLSTAQSIAITRGLVLSIHIDKDSIHIGLYKPEDPTP